MSTEMREMRERAIYPVLIPLASLVVIEVVVFSMSRVLLFVNHNQATAIALGVALSILIGASLVAARPRMGTGTIVGLLVFGLLVSVAAGGYALTQKPYYERAAEASRPEVAVAAADLSFDKETLELAADGTVIDFANEDSQPHNIAIYPSADELNAPLFKGEIINGGASVGYEVPAMDVGEYFFQCDVHPTMKGEAVVAEGVASEDDEAAH